MPIPNVMNLFQTSQPSGHTLSLRNYFFNKFASTLCVSLQPS